jgi:hypothetical protein
MSSLIALDNKESDRSHHAVVQGTFSGGQHAEVQTGRIVRLLTDDLRVEFASVSQFSKLKESIGRFNS